MLHKFSAEEMNEAKKKRYSSSSSSKSSRSIKSDTYLQKASNFNDSSS